MGSDLSVFLIMLGASIIITFTGIRFARIIKKVFRIIERNIEKPKNTNGDESDLFRHKVP